MWYISLPDSLLIRKVRSHIFLFNEFNGQSHIVSEYLQLVFECVVTCGKQKLEQDEFIAFLSKNYSEFCFDEVDWLSILMQAEQQKLLLLSTR